MEENRKVGLDVIRASAIIFVLSVHFFLNTEFYTTPLVGKSMYIQVFIRMTAIICVPLFIILTGYLQKNKQVTKSYYKKIIPILVLYVFYSIVAILFRIIILKENQSIVQWISLIEKFSACRYAWYIEMFIGLFLISPFLNLIYNNLRSKKKKIILIVLSIIMCACPAFFNGKIKGLINFPSYWSDMYPVMYYFIGCYINEYKPKIKKSYEVAVLFLVVLLEAFLEIYGASGGNFSTFVGYYGSLIIGVQAVVFFLIFYDLEIENNFAVKVISMISILSFDIYLVSGITDTIVYKILFKYYFVSQQRIILLFLPAVLCSFILAFTIAFIRNKIIKIR